MRNSGPVWLPAQLMGAQPVHPVPPMHVPQYTLPGSTCFGRIVVSLTRKIQLQHLQRCEVVASPAEMRRAFGCGFPYGLPPGKGKGGEE